VDSANAAGGLVAIWQGDSGARAGGSLGIVMDVFQGGHRVLAADRGERGKKGSCKHTVPRGHRPDNHKPGQAQTARAGRPGVSFFLRGSQDKRLDKRLCAVLGVAAGKGRFDIEIASPSSEAVHFRLLRVSAVSPPVILAAGASMRGILKPIVVLGLPREKSS
jgi:hypothetical protein